MLVFIAAPVHAQEEEKPRTAGPGPLERLEAARVDFPGRIDSILSEVRASAHGAEAEKRLAPLRATRTEAEIVNFGRSILGTPLGDPALHERALLETARRLGEVGGETGVALLGRIAEIRAGVTYPQLICRREAAIPVFPFATEARRAAFRIRQRAALAGWFGLSEGGRLDWLERLSTSDADGPEVVAALRVLSQASPDFREKARARLSVEQETYGRTRGRLLVALHLADGVPPTAEVFLRMDDASALRMLSEGAKRHPDLRAALTSMARLHRGVASAAVFLDESTGAMSVRDFLARDGASAAAILAKDARPEATLELEKILRDGAETEAVRRYAALALMFQNTTESREVIARGAGSAGLSPALLEKLQSWLNQHEPKS